MTTGRAVRGSLTGRWAPRADNVPNLRGTLTVEADLPAGTMLHLAGWTKEAGGGEFVSLSATVADKGGRWRGRRRHPGEPEGRFTCEAPSAQRR